MTNKKFRKVIETDLTKMLKDRNIELKEFKMYDLWATARVASNHIEYFYKYEYNEQEKNVSLTEWVKDIDGNFKDPQPCEPIKLQ